MATVIKLRAKLLHDDQVKVAVFAGQENQTLQLTGELRLRIGELQLLGAALTIGAEQMKGRLLIVHEGYLAEAQGGA